MWEAIFAAVRRVTVFSLGVLIIAAALADPESQNTISMLVIGMVMVGVLPIDDLPIWGRRHRRDPPPPP
jgi:hypothetical protein